ncbi:hypothetical protein M0805_002340 [Coniferiporia weirii]|nr:hypothetical protein M0805_002340 [Coniferiporia weirii]
MSCDMVPVHEVGQFDDAPEDTTVPDALVPTNSTPVVVSPGPRGNASYIDDPQLLEWSEPEEEEYTDEDEDGIREEDLEDNRVEDEDWDVTERDFTKQYNRLRQHVAVRSGVASGTQQATSKTPSAVASLPAVNRPRRAAVRVQLSSTSSPLEHQASKTSDQLAALSKYASRLKNIDEPYRMGMGASINRKGPSAHANMKDKADRATNEQVLDPRTRIILYKMIGRGLVQEINGCVSTGKEANVYHAVSPEGKHLALKIYKTSILVFKDRDRYVSGEHRFRRGYSRHNPRKMVRMWAEKEMRNLKRLVTAGLHCPEPLEVRENVLVMDFLGDEEGWASPRLKDAEIPASAFPQLYCDLLLTVRRLFHECRLVHADLSEYNILYHAGALFVIDVSQSVEHDHPHAFDFLRKDLGNVEDFFARHGVQGLGLRRAFEFVTRDREGLLRELSMTKQPVEGGDNKEGYEKDVLERWLAQAEDGAAEEAEDGGKDDSAAHAHEDAVFMRSYIPRNLNEVFDPERDVEALSRGDAKTLIYADTIGLVSPPTAPTAPAEASGKKEGELSVRFAEGTSGGLPPTSESEHVADEDSSESGEDGDESGSESGSGEGSGEVGREGRKPRGHRHEDREAKKERKKAVKEEAREKRKHKMKKADKKKKIKTTRHS